MGVITFLLYVLNVIAGGLVSIEKPMPGVVKLIHQVFPYLFTLAVGATIYYLGFP